MKLDDYLAGLAAAPPPLLVLGRSLQGVLSLNLGDACNYRCGYCTQRFQKDRSFVRRDPAPLLEALQVLPGAWEIKISGGEPFVQPLLLDLVTELVARGHVLSIQTNFSAPDALLSEFLERTRGHLATFSASLHLDSATPAQFLERYRRWLQPREAEGLRFNVTSVATPARLRELHDTVAPAFAAAGVVFKVQPEKVHGAVRDYSLAEQELLRALGGHNRTGLLAPNFQGRICAAGQRYFVIKSSGQAFRCYAASRVGGRYARLGSLAEGIELLPEPKVCPYTYCVCTVPIQRGMVQGLPAGASAGDWGG